MTTHLYTLNQARHDLPKRAIDADKTMAGRTLVMGGSAGLWGAAILTARAASRAGSGYVYLCTPEKQFPATDYPDILVIHNLEKLNFTIFDSIAVGPGFDHPQVLEKWLRKIASLSFKHVVVDAGALRTLAKMKHPPYLSADWILTPHEGELADLLGVSSKEIHEHRKQYAHLAQQMYGGIVLLKGHRTLIADNDNVWEIDSGNPALAKAGTGDVLTGIIAGLMAQGLSPIKAACLGAFIHGFAADEWLKESNDVLSLTPIDLLEKLPRILEQIRSSERKTTRNRHRGSSGRDLGSSL